MSESIQIEELHFAVRRSDRRATLEISVERDGSLTVAAPVGCSTVEIEQVLRGRLLWVYRRLQERASTQTTPQPKQYVSGEGFSYLGRTYRLWIVPPERNVPPLRFHHGRFLLDRDQQERGGALFRDWYSQHGQEWIERRLPLYVDRVGVHPTRVCVRELGYHWGSCSRAGVVNIHWRAFQSSPRLVDYILVHELVHLIEPHHGPTFWRRVERILPDYQERREWLQLNGSLG
jgi:predicted metal-dependent hydrolase